MEGSNNEDDEDDMGVEDDEEVFDE
jgi:hypothetical protein